MKNLKEIVRELCWNPELQDAFEYLVNDRKLEISIEEIELVHSKISDYIDLAYFPNPYENRSINMNDFVDQLEEMVWENYENQLQELEK